MPKIFALVTGFGLIVLGILGIFGFQIGSAANLREPGDIALHLIVGIVSVAVGLTQTPWASATRQLGKIEGLGFILLSIAGSMQPGVVPGILHLDPVCNLVHLMVGLWGVWVGFFAVPGDELLRQLHAHGTSHA